MAGHDFPLRRARLSYIKKETAVSRTSAGPAAFA